MALLEETRAAVPAFPVDLLPPFWRDWVLDTANATGAPADYVRRTRAAARRVTRWLRGRGLGEVSREQVRTEALGSRVDAAEADQVLYRLQNAGVLQRALYTAPLRGRPPNRWWVNPRLNAPLSAGDTGNAGKS